MNDNIFQCGENGIAITLSGLQVSINNKIYNEPVCIARLLTVSELERLSSFSNETALESSTIDEEIVHLTFHSFLGITDSVNWDEIEAGVISIISQSIRLKSISMISDPIGAINQIRQQIGLYDSIQAIVSRFMATPFDVVKNLPINELLKRYAICIETFPEEVRPPAEKEE